MKPITITLDYPDRCLSPNARAHWSETSRHRRRQRHQAMLLVRAEMGRRRAPKWAEATVTIQAATKTRARPDRDNLLASLKGAFDGVEDAGLIANDAGFHYAPVEFIEPDRARPHVILTFTERTPA